LLNIKANSRYVQGRQKDLKRKEKKLGLKFWLSVVIFMKILIELANTLTPNSSWSSVFEK